MLSVEMVRGDKRLWAERDDEKWFGETADASLRTAEQWSDEQMATLAGDFFRDGCDRFTVYLEDVIVVCYGNDDRIEAHRPVVAFDVITGTHHRVYLTDDQIVAILMLGIGGDEIACAGDSYRVLQDVMQNWPVECRPIP